MSCCDGWNYLVDGQKINGECASEIHRLEREVEELREDLKLIERWAVYKIGKHTAEECLSVIQHYPPIKAITKSYKDGVIPTSYNPYSEIEQLRSKVAELEEVVEKYGAITVRTLRQIIESTIKPSQPKEGEK